MFKNITLLEATILYSFLLYIKNQIANWGKLDITRKLSSWVINDQFRPVNLFRLLYFAELSLKKSLMGVNGNLHFLNSLERLCWCCYYFFVSLVFSFMSAYFTLLSHSTIILCDNIIIIMKVWVYFLGGASTSICHFFRPSVRPMHTISLEPYIIWS